MTDNDNDNDHDNRAHAHADGQARLPMDPVPVEPLDPLMLAEVLEALALRQAALERAFDALHRRLGTTPKDGPWAWAALGAHRRRELLVQLRDWVDWLITRYDLRAETQTIPPCSHRHPVAVEELTALMVAWQGAYSADEAAPSDALIAWHDRWLWPTLHRLNEQLRVWAKCTGGTHQPARPAPQVTDDADFAAFLDPTADEASTAASAGPTLSADTVRDLLAAGRAVALLPDDPLTPINCEGRWYAVAHGDDSQTWTRLDDDHATQLDAIRRRLNAVHASRGPS